MTERSAYALAIHGGAGPTPGRDYAAVEEHLAQLLARGEAMLRDRCLAVDVAEDIVCELENSGLYVAGRGTAANAAGVREADASIMDGVRMKAGGVGAVHDLANPISAARMVMEETPHVLLVGEGAHRMLGEHGIVPTLHEDDYTIPAGVRPEEVGQSELRHGTVGAAVLDRQGRLAAATSTGGLFGRSPGRMGDSGIVGIGTWADEKVALSCTGVGESFILAGGARSAAQRFHETDMSLHAACGKLLHDVEVSGGDGGLIAIDSMGRIELAYNSAGMKRASLRAGEPPFVAVFDSQALS